MTKTRVSNERENRETAVKHVLYNYRYYVADYNACFEQYAELYPSCTGQIKEVVSFGFGGNAGESKLISIVDHRIHLHNDLAKKQNRIRLIENSVNNLPPDQAVIIRRCFMDKREFDNNGNMVKIGVIVEKVCDELNISVASFWRQRQKAIEILSEKVIVNDSEMGYFT